VDLQEYARAPPKCSHYTASALRQDRLSKLLRDHGYSLQAPSKAVEGTQHPDRNAQFEHINAKAQDCIQRGVPVISVDTKKKEAIGNFKNGGREWQPKGQAPPGGRPRRSVQRGRQGDPVRCTMSRPMTDSIRERGRRSLHAGVRGHLE
jgi:hypothetical protein